VDLNLSVPLLLRCDINGGVYTAPKELPPPGAVCRTCRWYRQGVMMDTCHRLPGTLEVWASSAACGEYGPHQEEENEK